MKATIIHLDPRAESVTVLDSQPDYVAVTLVDGRIIAFPVAWSPRLMRATLQERRHVRLESHGRIVHWPDVDEDIDVAALLGLESIVVPPDGDLSIHDRSAH